MNKQAPRSLGKLHLLRSILEKLKHIILHLCYVLFMCCHTANIIFHHIGYFKVCPSLDINACCFFLFCFFRHHSGINTIEMSSRKCFLTESLQYQRNIHLKQTKQWWPVGLHHHGLGLTLILAWRKLYHSLIPAHNWHTAARNNVTPTDWSTTCLLHALAWFMVVKTDVKGRH